LLRLCGLSVASCTEPCLAVRTRPLFEFRLPLELHPANPSRPAAADRLLSWTFLPFSTYSTRRSTRCGLSTTHFVPPTGFGHPLGGFLPPSTGRLCFTPTALMGFALRSFPLSKGIRGVSAAEEPAYRFSHRSLRRNAATRPDGPRFPGFDPFESPWHTDALLTRRRLDAPLGFTPSRARR
jgi:hypothetical protein